jgi:hypothetical protein
MKIQSKDAKMTNRSYFFPAIAITFAVILGAPSSNASAGDLPTASWIKDEMTLDSAAQIYLSPAFTTIKGKFKAMPESITDTRDSIDGNFLVGEYRYLFKKPEAGKDGTMSDELVSTEVLDCKDNFFGTIKQVRKYKGRVVNNSATPAADVRMIQTNIPNIGLKLCALYQGKKASGLEHTAPTNPSYNPRPTEKDIDRIMDKYTTPKAKNAK